MGNNEMMLGVYGTLHVVPVLERFHLEVPIHDFIVPNGCSTV